MNKTETGPLSSRNLRIFTGVLLILLLGGLFNYGSRVLWIAIVSVLVAVPIELAFKKARKQPLYDDSLFITPLLIALLVPSIAPLWMVGIGSGFAVFFGKCIFGGLGKTVFNPALVGIIFVMVSFPPHMTATSWLDPNTGEVTGMIPVLELHLGQALTHSVPQLLFGQVPGMIGETFIVLVAVMGLLLVGLKIVDWRIPLSYLGSFFVLTALGYLLLPDYFVNPFYSMITGGIVFAAFFLASDPATSPEHPWAKYFFGLGLAVLTIIIRNFGTFQEGYAFSIIIMNAVAPLLDGWLEQKKPINEESASLEEEMA